MKTTTKQIETYLKAALLVLLFSHTAFSQQKKSGDTLILHKVTYANGRLSAYSWLLQSTGNGRATSWDPKGKVLFDSEISRNHGHHSVHFEHHPNKVISRVEESSAPDAGIQWYRSTYYFDETGNKTGENHQSHEDLMHVRVPEHLIVPQEQVVATTAKYYSETWLINQTEFELVVSCTMNNTSQSDTLRSGDSVLIDTRVHALHFEQPPKNTAFKAAPKKQTKRSSKWEFVFQPCGEEKKTNDRTRYYFAIGQKLAPKKKRT